MTTAGSDGQQGREASPGVLRGGVVTICALSKGCGSVFRGDMPCQLPPGHLLGDLPHRHECKHIPGCTDWVEWDDHEHVVADSTGRTILRWSS